MEEEGLPFGYTHGQHKVSAGHTKNPSGTGYNGSWTLADPEQRSHAQMDEEAGSTSPAWRYQAFAEQREAPHHYDASHTGLTLNDDYAPAPLDQQRRTPTFDDDDDDDPPTHYQAFEQRPTPNLDSALRSRGWEEVAPRHIDRAPPAATSSRPGRMMRLEGVRRMIPRRYVGDGFDFRRPASAAQEQEAGSVDLTGDDDDDIMVDMRRDDVIDLTADDSGYGASQDGNNGQQRPAERVQEQQESSRARRGNGAPRLPRGMDIIIDLDNGEEEWRMATPPAPEVPEPSSPDIQFISSRAIEGRRLPPPTMGGNNSDDEVEFLREVPLPEAEVARRRAQELDNVLDLFGTLNGRFTHLRAQVDRFHASVHRTATRLNEPIAPHRSRHAHIRVGAFVAPALDFDAVAFDLGPRGRDSVPPPPTYEAPPKAPEGFTRSPEEEDALICPNCEEELCVGSDDIKRQVWIVKGCGHVYCGECTANRSAKRSAKGKEKPTNTEPFKVCVVDGCDKNVSSKKAMIQVFL
ncbi:hypothetical protein L13192_09222 [Pyrenophora tritici-repentis]|uniref:Uncharacterized protein n=1 Tax=Pyrenophora tritici-repentis TaxID=45151 RepID=A0A922NHQ2_9PLEO|nr:hypothetical protein Ptr86124_007049 [Pyrenophora tritici-repentis]KAI1666978.1 hypothetical protein L13192_09222 [Pyrenophora tritici-repentis]KAI1682824.1 hypothetical protein KJE20_07556 [Pyrenophora tritici-repentis]